MRRDPEDLTTLENAFVWVGSILGSWLIVASIVVLVLYGCGVIR